MHSRGDPRARQWGNSALRRGDDVPRIELLAPTGKAAQRLGMNRNTLHKKIKQYKLDGTKT